MVHHHFGLVLLALGVGCVVVACSDDDPADGQGGGDSGSGATSGSGGSTATGTGGSSANCPTGLFDNTSCDGFLDGCYAPDTNGTCTDSGTELTWSDGHKIIRTGANAGLYGSGDAMPCITLEFDTGTSTATLTHVGTGEVLQNQDQGDGTILITCPEGDEHTFTIAELEEDNVCKGLSCGREMGGAGGSPATMCSGAADCPGEECCSLGGSQTCFPAGACVPAGGMVIP